MSKAHGMTSCVLVLRNFDQYFDICKKKSTTTKLSQLGVIKVYQIPSKDTQPIFIHCWFKLANLTIFYMPIIESLLPTHIGWPHVLCELGFLNQY